MSQDFTSIGLFSKTEGGTGFHEVKLFDGLLFSKSETMMFLAVTNWKDSSNKVVRVAAHHVC